jgi:hypothetical protein
MRTSVRGEGLSLYAGNRLFLDEEVAAARG